MTSYTTNKVPVQRLLLAVVASVGILSSSAHSVAANPASFGRDLDGSVRRMSEGQPSLAPFAHVRFCLANPEQCIDTGGADAVKLSAQRRTDLSRVNSQVNRSIRPMNDSVNQDVWTMDVDSGDCEDYALTKRKRLLQLGWSSRALRIAIAHTRNGEGHAVLVVKTTSGDIVLDNRFDAIKDWRNTDLRWVKIQSGKNPKRWLDLRNENAPAIELVSNEGEHAIRHNVTTQAFDIADAPSQSTAKTITIRPSSAIRVIDGATFQYLGKRYRLSGVGPMSGSTICQNANGGLFACGLRRVKALSDAIRGKVMRCNVLKAEQKMRYVSCTANGMDVAALL